MKHFWKQIIVVALMTGMCLCAVSAMAFGNEQADTEEMAEITIIDSDGFNYVDEKWGWYKDGSLQSSMTGIIKGTINGKESWYYIRNGVFTKETGFTKLADGSYYKKWFYVTDGELTTGWVKYNNKYYYFSPRIGALHTGWLYFNGNEYYISPTTGALKTGWLYYGGYYFYLSPKTGLPVTGTQTIGGKTYTFNDKGICIG